MTQQLVAATTNHHKLSQFCAVAAEFGIVVLSPLQIAEKKKLPPLPDVEEDGITFLENARKKALACAAWCGEPSFGDDSGLCVRALNGKPGVYSSRYAGPGANDQKRIEKLLYELSTLARSNAESPGAIDRRAEFLCALVLVFPSGQEISAEGSSQGTILNTPRGNQGFGYDPIFFLEDVGKTLAELDFAETCRTGFRARAARSLFCKLKG